MSTHSADLCVDMGVGTWVDMCVDVCRHVRRHMCGHTYLHCMLVQGGHGRNLCGYTHLTFVLMIRVWTRVSACVLGMACRRVIQQAAKRAVRRALHQQADRTRLIVHDAAQPHDICVGESTEGTEVSPNAACLLTCCCYHHHHHHHHHYHYYYEVSPNAACLLRCARVRVDNCVENSVC